METAQLGKIKYGKKKGGSHDQLSSNCSKMQNVLSLHPPLGGVSLDESWPEWLLISFTSFIGNICESQLYFEDIFEISLLFCTQLSWKCSLCLRYPSSWIHVKNHIIYIQEVFQSGAASITGCQWQVEVWSSSRGRGSSSQSFCSQLVSAELLLPRVLFVFVFCPLATGLTLIQLVTLPHCSLSIWITRPREPKKTKRARASGRERVEALDHVRGIRGWERENRDETGLDDGAGGEDETRLLADGVVSNEAARSVSTDQLKKPRAEESRRRESDTWMRGGSANLREKQRGTAEYRPLAHFFIEEKRRFAACINSCVDSSSFLLDPLCRLPAGHTFQTSHQNVIGYYLVIGLYSWQEYFQV